MKKLEIFSRGIIKENPVLVMMLGLCPALAVSTHAMNAIGMGAATTFVLIGANCTVSLLRKVIPDTVRIPCFIVIIAGFVALVQMLVEAFAFTLHLALGIFLALIVVNCIVFARAEVFAKNNNVIDAFIDALGMGAGFTLALLAIASVREIFGSGTIFGIQLPVLIDNTILVFILAPGGFVTFGLIIAIFNKLFGNTAVQRKDFNCTTCPTAPICGGKHVEIKQP